MSKKEITVSCNACDTKFKRHIDIKYIRENGSQTCSSYCRTCIKKKGKAYRGKTSEDLMTERTYEQMGVRFLSKHEIAELSLHYR